MSNELEGKRGVLTSSLRIIVHHALQKQHMKGFLENTKSCINMFLKCFSRKNISFPGYTNTVSPIFSRARGGFSDAEPEKSKQVTNAPAVPRERKVWKKEMEERRRWFCCFKRTLVVFCCLSFLALGLLSRLMER